MEALSVLYREFGLWPFLVIILVYVFLKGRFVFEYPRRDKK